MRLPSARRVAGAYGPYAAQHALLIDRVDEVVVGAAPAQALVAGDESLGVLDDGRSHVDAAGALDAFQPWRAVDLEDLGAARSLEHVHAGHLEAHDLRCGHG